MIEFAEKGGIFVAVGKKTEKEDQLNWRYQDKAYNEQFKKWRKQSRNSHGFYYVDNSNELTYRDGYGYVKKYPEAVESKALRHVYGVLGVIILFTVFIDVIRLYILPLLLEMLGVDIYYDYFTGRFYGNEWLITVIYIVFELFKRVFPMIYIYRKLKMPINVMLPVKIINPEMFTASIPVSMLVGGLCVSVSAIYEELLKIIGIGSLRVISLPDDPAVAVVMIAANVIILPTISELFFKGAVMQLLRQFGDGFAIIITSAMSALLLYNVHRFCYVFIAAVVCGYFTIRSGSVMTAVVMRIVCSGLLYAVYCIDFYIGGELSGIIIMMLLFISLITGVVAMIKFMTRHSDKLGMSLKPRYLSFSRKILEAFTCIPFVTGMMMIIIMIIINLRFYS